MRRKIPLLREVTYRALIKEAIYSQERGKATTQEIFGYLIRRYPGTFLDSNSSTWKGNVRTVLSLTPEFVKVGGKKRGNEWIFDPGEVFIQEARLRRVLFEESEATVEDKSNQHSETKDNQMDMRNIHSTRSLQIDMEDTNSSTSNDQENTPNNKPNKDS